MGEGILLCLLYSLSLCEGGVEIDRSTDECLECTGIHLLPSMDVDCAARVPVEAGIEELVRVFWRSSSYLFRKSLSEVM